MHFFDKTDQIWATQAYCVCLNTSELSSVMDVLFSGLRCFSPQTDGTGLCSLRDYFNLLLHGCRFVWWAGGGRGLQGEVCQGLIAAHGEAGMSVIAGMQSSLTTTCEPNTPGEPPAHSCSVEVSSSHAAIRGLFDLLMWLRRPYHTVI